MKQAHKANPVSCLLEGIPGQRYICQTQIRRVEQKPNYHRHLGEWTRKKSLIRRGL